MTIRLSLASLFASLALILSVSASSFPGAQIKDFQVFPDGTGLVYTSEAVYRTVDGRSWYVLPVPLGITERIADVNFVDPLVGSVLLPDPTGQTIALAVTKDGGKTWSRRVISLEGAVELELDLENAQILGDPAGALTINLRVPTSSNFVGRASYSSTDGGLTWQFAGRNVEPNSEQKVSAVNQKGNWSVETSGECLGFKSGCIQVTRLFIAGVEATPGAIKEAASREREAAWLEVQASPIFSAPGGSTRISLNRGFDKCQNSSVSSMQLWWDNSYFFDANIYFSGRNRACAQTLTATWVDQVSSMGWGLIPTVVGYQSPCTSSLTTAKFSYDPAVAEQQGRGEADIAAADAANLGLTAGSVLYYDLERYDETVSSPGCRTASTAFIKGWTDRIKELGYKSGTYGSPKNAQEDWVTLPPASKMDAIWMARWDNVQSVWTYVSFSSFPTNEWANHQRIKQWQAPHNETWGGVTFNIDGNIADGPVAGIPVAKNQVGDFDGDLKTDVAVYRASDGVWYIINSSTWTFSFVSFGAQSDVIVPADYDGDGKTDQAVYRPSDGMWYIRGKAGTFSAVPWGAPDDIPVPADYNGDGKADVAVFRPSDGYWYIFNSDSQRTYTFIQWGAAGDKPVPGDYDGDGKTDLAIYRPSNGVWWFRYSSDQSLIGIQWGIETDLPAQGDYDGDGRTDLAVVRDGVWWMLRSTDGVLGVQWGFGTDLPIPGDYDGDGRTDLSVFRPSDGYWYLNRSQLGFGAVSWGYGTDLPVPRGYIPN